MYGVCAITKKNMVSFARMPPHARVSVLGRIGPSRRARAGPAGQIGLRSAPFLFQVFANLVSKLNL